MTLDVVDDSHDIPIIKTSKFLDYKRFQQLRKITTDIINSDDSMFVCPRGFNRKLTVDPQILKIIQHEKQAQVEAVFGVKLKPSFTILSMYHEGGNCYYHYDREMCRYMVNISVLSTCDWPLKINDNVINLNDNDAIYMSGTYHKHGREGILGAHEQVANAFIYYVESNYEGPLW